MECHILLNRQHQRSRFSVNTSGQYNTPSSIILLACARGGLSTSAPTSLSTQTLSLTLASSNWKHIGVIQHRVISFQILHINLSLCLQHHDFVVAESRQHHLLDDQNHCGFFSFHNIPFAIPNHSPQIHRISLAIPSPTPLLPPQPASLLQQPPPRPRPLSRFFFLPCDPKTSK